MNEHNVGYGLFMRFVGNNKTGEYDNKPHPVNTVNTLVNEKLQLSTCARAAIDWQPFQEACWDRLQRPMISNMDYRRKKIIENSRTNPELMCSSWQVNV